MTTCLGMWRQPGRQSGAEALRGVFTEVGFHSGALALRQEWVVFLPSAASFTISTFLAPAKGARSRSDQVPGSTELSTPSHTTRRKHDGCSLTHFSEMLVLYLSRVGCYQIIGQCSW